MKEMIPLAIICLMLVSASCTSPVVLDEKTEGDILNTEIQDRGTFYEQNKGAEDLVSIDPKFTYFYDYKGQNIPQFFDLNPSVKSPPLNRQDNLDVYAEMNYQHNWIFWVCIINSNQGVWASKVRADNSAIRLNKDFPFNGTGFVITYFQPNSASEEDWINQENFFTNCSSILEELKIPNFLHKEEMRLFEISTPPIPNGLFEYYKNEEFNTCSDVVSNFLNNRECKYGKNSPYYGMSCDKIMNLKSFMKFHENTCCNEYYNRYIDLRPQMKDALICN